MLFDGHPVVAVVAVTEEIAEDAAGLVMVEYDELEAAVELEATLADPREFVHSRKNSAGARTRHPQQRGGKQR